jgi:hypothetical protein
LVTAVRAFQDAVQVVEEQMKISLDQLEKLRSDFDREPSEIPDGVA